MPTKEDLRVVKTKRNIEETFLSLLEKSTFERITIKQILEAKAHSMRIILTSTT